jgi:hypothetical protein
MKSRAMRIGGDLIPDGLFIVPPEELIAQIYNFNTLILPLSLVGVTSFLCVIGRVKLLNSSETGIWEVRVSL